MRLQSVAKIIRIALPPLYSMLVASLLANFWSALPIMFFKAWCNIESGEREILGFTFSKSNILLCTLL